MNKLFHGALLAPFLAWASKLRHPALLKIIGALFLLSVLLPDPVPLLDEIILGLGALLLAQWKARPSRPRRPVILEGRAQPLRTDI